MDITMMMQMVVSGKARKNRFLNQETGKLYLDFTFHVYPHICCFTVLHLTFVRIQCTVTYMHNTSRLESIELCHHTTLTSIAPRALP
jgi:hypothetical protein